MFIFKSRHQKIILMQKLKQFINHASSYLFYDITIAMKKVHFSILRDEHEKKSR